MDRLEGFNRLFEHRNKGCILYKYIGGEICRCIL